MDGDEYVKTRLDDQIAWYDRRSASNKRANTATKLIEIGCAAIIPFLSGYATPARPWVAIIIGILGVIVAVSAGTAALLKYHEQWLKYRTTAESLKKEKFFFQTKVDPYAGADSLGVLVRRVEALVSDENTTWSQYMVKPAKGE